MFENNNEIFGGESQNKSVGQDELKSKTGSNKKAIISTLFGAGAAGTIAFVAADMLNKPETIEIDENTAEDTPLIAVDSTLNEDIQMEQFETNSSNFLGIKDHSSSFDEAFFSQRELQGPGGIFQYDGKYYNTYYKEEWENMSDGQKDSYVEMVGSKLNGENITNFNDLAAHQNGNLTSLDLNQAHIITPGTSEIEVMVMDPTDDYGDMVENNNDRSSDYSSDDELLENSMLGDNEIMQDVTQDVSDVEPQSVFIMDNEDVDDYNFEDAMLGNNSSSYDTGLNTVEDIYDESSLDNNYHVKINNVEILAENEYQPGNDEIETDMLGDQYDDNIDGLAHLDDSDSLDF